MRVMYSCSELGLGHAARTNVLGRRLKENGHELFFFSGGKAYSLLKEEFEHVHECTPVSWYENAHGIITSASLLNILFPLPFFNSESKKFEVKSSSAMETIHRYYELRRLLKDISPELLIADGDIHALRLAGRWNLRSIYITNLIRPSYGFSSFLNPGERFTERYVKNCHRIIIPDNPPPFTVSEHDIGNLSQIGIKDKTEFVGSFFDTSPVRGKEDFIFAPISGPPGTRARLANLIIPVLKNLGTKSVISLGIPGQKKSATLENCEIYSWLSPSERTECMKNCSIVIFSGGHITCFETIKYLKPSICIPTQPEQMGNSRKLEEMGCSMVSNNQTELKRTIQKMRNEMPTFKKNIEKLNAYSRRFNGLDRAVEIIENIAL
jgi:uncharacterized protein (TIGR00661 family)